jgi:hypothetical protein
VKVDVWLASQLRLDEVCLFDGVLETERESEGKVCYLLLRVTEVMIELKHKLCVFIVLVEPVGRLCDYPAPFLLLRRQNTEYRLKSLTIQL